MHMWVLQNYIWDGMAESKLYQQSKLMFPAIREKYPLECVCVYNSVSLIWAYFYHKLLVFLYEYVRVFALNTVEIFCFKT